MRQQDANTIADVVIDLVVRAQSGMADAPERIAIERMARRLSMLPKVSEWIGYHVEAMRDDETRHDELLILEDWLPENTG